MSAINQSKTKTKGSNMAALGLGSLKDKKKTDKAKKGSQADEAKAILERMEQKKDAGDCPFC